MGLDLLIKDGTLVTPDGLVEANLLVEDGRIVGRVSHRETLPGIVDPHVHFEGPNSIDTYRSGTEAAALGGVTSVVNFAWQAWEGSDTPWSGAGTLREAVDRQREAAASSLVDVALHGTITRERPEVLDELEGLVEDGVVSFKVFTTYDFGLRNGFIERIFEKLSELDAVAVLHTEDDDVCTAREDEMRRSGRGDPVSYPESRPTHAEAMAADDAVRLALQSGVKYYGIHTSCAEAADVIEAAQTDNSRIRGETCVHYTTLTEAAHADQGNLPMIAPPLRSEADVDSIFEHLRGGTLDVVSTDHVAYKSDSKQVENWWDGEYGANSVQRSLPVFHDEAVLKRGLSYPALVRLMSTNPARIFGLTNKGTLEVGTDADIVVFDPNATWTVTSEDNASKADFSIYEGRELTGRVERTYLRGTCIAADGETTVQPGYGRAITRERPDWDAF